MNLNAKIVIDLGFGDAGKGTIVDFLARQTKSSTVVRFNGGSQAAHNVITPEGIHHTFAQFGSNMLTPNSKTHLSRFVLIDPIAMEKEASHIESLGFGNPFLRTTVDKDALVITSFQKAANRVRELERSGGRHGSCGMGIGETMADMIEDPNMAVRAKDLLTYGTLLSKLRKIFKKKKIEFESILSTLNNKDALGNKYNSADDMLLLTDENTVEAVANALTSVAWKLNIVSGNFLKLISEKEPLIFEGAQGVLIDEWHGFHPYTTWSTTTFKNALTLLSEIDYIYPIEKIGVIRSYQTRHGAGPFVTEDKYMTKALPDMHNGMGRWQGGFRVGWLDLVMTKYAITVSCGVDRLAVTHLDKMSYISNWKICKAYDIPTNMLSSNDNVVLEDKNQRTPNTRRINNIKEKDVLDDLTYQETLTKLLDNVTPVYSKVISNKEKYLNFIENELNIPIVITSHGPTAIEKKYIQT